MKAIDQLLDQYQLSESQEEIYLNSSWFIMDRLALNKYPMDEQVRILRKRIIFRLLAIRGEMMEDSLRLIFHENPYDWTLLEGNQYIESILTDLYNLSFSDLFDEYTSGKNHSPPTIDDLAKMTDLVRPGSMRTKS